MLSLILVSFHDAKTTNREQSGLFLSVKINLETTCSFFIVVIKKAE